MSYKDAYIELLNIVAFTQSKKQEEALWMAMDILEKEALKKGYTIYPKYSELDK